MPRKKATPTEPLPDPPEMVAVPPESTETPVPESEATAQLPAPPRADVPFGENAAAEPMPETSAPVEDTPTMDVTEIVDVSSTASPGNEGYIAADFSDTPLEEETESHLPPEALLESPELSDDAPESTPRETPVPPSEGPVLPVVEVSSSAEKVSEMSDRDKFFHLDFRKLDRDLTEEERKEWNAIYASYRGRSPLSGTVIGVDLFSLNIRSRKTGKVHKRDLYCAIVVPHRVRILIPETEMWLDSEKAGRSLNHLMGATLRFTVIKVDRENGFALASRKLAMKARRTYFARRPELMETGARLKCSVIDVGPVRCLVECYGHDITLTQKDLCYVSVSDLRYAYRPGQELDCVVTSYDPKTDKLKVSVKAALSDPFEGAEQRHPVNSRRQAVISGKYAGGVFCNLPDGTVCMCSYAYQYEDSDFDVGDTVILAVKRFDSTKRQMYGKILSKW